MSSFENTGSVAPPARASAAPRFFMLGMGLFVIIAIIAHGLALHAMPVSGDQVAIESLERVSPNQRTRIFAGVGVAFLAFTWLSHLPLAHKLHARERDSTQAGDKARVDVISGDFGPIGNLLVSMAIRVAGTFLILGLLWKLELVSQKESVFNVLFWYVTLTSMEVVGIVWASRSFVRSSPLGGVSQVSES